MVRHLIGLKARLTWNGVRTDVQRRFGLPVATGLLLWLGIWLAGTHHEMATHLATANPAALDEYLAWTSLIMFLVWVALPVIIFPLDENLDPQQLAVLPVSHGQMVYGLTAASLVAPSTVVPLLVITANATVIPAAWWIALPASLIYLGLMTVGSQGFSAAISAILRTRRGRDIATFLVLAIAAASFLGYRTLSQTVDSLGMEQAVLSTPLTNVSWLIPPVAAQNALIRASAGDVIGALAALAVAALWLGILALVWKALLGWLLTTPIQQSRPARRARQSGMTSGLWGTIPAMARKELKFYIRDPRQRLVWTGAVIFVGLAVAGVLMNTTGFFDIRNREWAPLVAPILVMFVGLPIALNLFGWERNAASYLFVLPVKPYQLLAGKNLAVASALALETLILALGLASFTGEWGLLWMVLPLTIAAIGSQLAVGNLVSVLTPLRLPREGTDVFAQSTEQGCLAIVSQALSFFAIGLLLVPPASMVVLAVGFGRALPSWFATVASIVWGLALYAISLFLASRLLRRRLPEVLAWVQII